MSVVTVSANAKNVYEELKNDKKHRYVIYHITENEIDVESIGERHLTYNDVLNELTKLQNNVRYIVVDFPVEGVDKPILLLWCPSAGQLRQRMLYSNGIAVLTQALVGIYKKIEVTDLDEASLAAVEKNVK